MSLKIREQQVLYDAKGRKTHVVLPYETYEELLQRLEDAEDLKAIREVENEPSLPWDDVNRRLLKRRK
jgi:hypothetical protein